MTGSVAAVLLATKLARLAAIAFCLERRSAVSQAHCHLTRYFSAAASSSWRFFSA